MFPVYKSVLCICVHTATLYFLFQQSAKSEIVSDNSLNTSIEKSNDTSVIISGGKKIDSTIFHSFQEFSSRNEESSIIFETHRDTKLILGRITGKNRSNISSNINFGNNIHLILLNPNGFNLRSNVNFSGSASLLTASDIFFNGNQHFGISGMSTNLLNLNLKDLEKILIPKNSLTNGYINITDNSFTSTSLQQGLSLIASEFLIKDAVIYAPAGNIYIGSIGAKGEAKVTFQDSSIQLSDTSKQELGNVHLNNSFITTADEDSFSLESGDITIHGKDISIENRTFIDTLNFGRKKGGNINILAKGLLDLNNSVLAADIEAPAQEGGDVKIDSHDLLVRDGSTIQSQVFSGDGIGGNILIENKKNITVQGGEVQGISGFSQIATQTFSRNSGHAGNIFITSPRIILKDGGLISSNTTGNGNGGNISLIASEQVSVTGKIFQTFSNQDFFSSISSASLLSTATGNGGNITIKAPNLVVSEGGFISAAINEGGQGRAGSITLDLTGALKVQNPGSRISVESNSSQESGLLEIDAAQILLDDFARISSNSNNSGSAGNIDISSVSVFLNNNSILSSETTGGQGNLIFDVDTLFLNNNSGITSNALNSVDGGNIRIISRSILGLGDSDITANAIQGTGGNIDIDSGVLIGFNLSNELTNQSDIIASSQFGVDGSINIQVTEDPNSELVELPSSFISSTDRVDNVCNSNIRSVNQVKSSFSTIGKEGRNLQQDYLENNELQKFWIGSQYPPQQFQSSHRKNSHIRSSISNMMKEATKWEINQSGNIALVSDHTIKPISNHCT